MVRRGVPRRRRGAARRVLGGGRPRREHGVRLYLVYTAVSRARDTPTLVREEGAAEYAAAHAEGVRWYQRLG